MYYLILLASFIVFAGVITLTHFVFKKHERLIIERIIPFVVIAIFIVRFMSYNDVQVVDANFSIFEHFGGYSNKFINTIGELCLWFEITAALMVMMKPFFHFKTATFYNKFIALPVLFVSAIALKPMLLQMQGHDNWSALTVLLPIEIGSLLALSLYFFSKEWKIRIAKHSYPEVAVFSVLVNFATMPAFIPMFFFGLGNIHHNIYDFSIYHRLVLYFVIAIIPLSIYFAFRNCNKDKIRYGLLFIVYGTLLNFMVYTRWDDILQPWNWPFHLCNLAMILFALCFTFKLNKLFYFTYFINVFGAILAMLMPNYSETATLWDPAIVQFWYNHAMAYMLPILGVALYEFDRPKLKQYGYSMIGFACYFVLVLILNTVFTGLAPEYASDGYTVIREGASFVAFGRKYTVEATDFFFINGTFIADKLGEWAKNLFKMSFAFNINGRVMTIHPIYQVIYFTVYAIIGFGVWFIYQICFDIADSHNALRLKLKGIRTDRIALRNALDGRSLFEPMDKDAGVKLELKNFSKKYGLNKYYSVKDANLVVNGGEVFGFLGHNGAGKSTIIKSIVGILPITEGDIEVCGYNVKSQPVQAKSLIGFVPDHYALYEKLTAREYLNYIADIYEVSKEDRDARLNEYVKLFELESAIDNQIKTYSHGMKQKVTIIAALIHNPKVWILDEPLTGLDPTSIFQVKECMRRHAQAGNIVFFSSHMIDIVEKLCDRIAIIKHGVIQTVNSVKEIEDSGVSLEEFYLSKIGDMKKE